MYLATTGLTELWDKSGPVIALGEWCRREDRRAEWSRLQLEVLPYPLAGRAELVAGAARCESLADAVLVQLAEVLNQAHGVSRSLRYWRILIGPWLLHYVGIVYERYLCLIAAVNACPRLRTTRCANSAGANGLDLVPMLARIHQDEYNWQLYSQIGDQLGLPAWKSVQISPPAAGPRATLARRALQRGAPRCLRIWAAGATVWYAQPRLSRSARLRTWLESRGNALPIAFGALAEEPVAVLDYLSRRPLAVVPGSEDEFARVLGALLPSAFPRAYWEGYRPLRQYLAPLLRCRPEAVLAPNNQLSASFRMLAAELSEQGTRLIALQHGGSYGAALLSPMERHDQTCADQFWSWGWKTGVGPAPVRPMPALLTRRGGGSRPQDLILYCANSNPRFHHRFWSHPIGPQWTEVIAWRHRWLSALDPALRNVVAVRLYPAAERYGWAEQQHLQRQFPDLCLQSARRSFPSVLGRCRLFVTDTNHTTLLEAMAAGIPTLLFWDPQRCLLRPSAAPYYEGLRHAGVLFDSPEEAAAAVSRIWAAPQTWWESARVRSAVIPFLNCFALDSGGASEWRRSLAALARASAPAQLAPGFRFRPKRGRGRLS